MTLFADTAGERLDAFLARQPGNLSRSAAQRLIEEGMVTRNGVPGKKNDRLNVGDRVEYAIPEAKPVDIVPTEMPLDIVYEDDDLLVINKAQGAGGASRRRTRRRYIGQRPALRFGRRPFRHQRRAAPGDRPPHR